MPTFASMKQSYIDRWAACSIRPDGVSGAESCANKIIRNQVTYKKVEAATGVPWWWVGCIHSMESDCDFSTWLANGDDLGGPTTQDPVGLVCNGTWLDGAIVSLKHEGYDNEKDWSRAHSLYLAEMYNGDGYATRGLPSQYIWSFTNIEQAGRYVADRKWDAKAWSGQIGVAAMLIRLISRGVVTFESAAPVSTVPAGKVTWYEANRNDKGDTVIIGMAGDKAVSLLTTNDSSVIVKYLTENGVHDLRVAPAGKAIPHMPGSGTGPAPTPAPVSSVIQAKLNAFYSVKANYDAVYANVMSWFGTTSQGCVAFMSTALRMVGVNIPLHYTVRGEDSSLVTLPFSIYLQENLGWKKITDQSELIPGDVCFTTDDPDWPGYPAHTYMFQEWTNKSDGIANVVDNQAFTHERNINEGGGGFNFSPWVYALRAP